MKQYDEQLRLIEAEREQLSRRHLPSGRPTVDGQVALQSLWQKDYVSAYSPALGLPLWTAYTVTNQVISFRVFRVIVTILIRIGDVKKVLF